MRTDDLGSGPTSSDDAGAQSGGEGLANRHMIGRQRELNEMAGALERAMTGIGAVVVVSGEAGIGKTRLAREFSRIAAGQDARVLWANCRAGGEPRADYWPWRQVFRAIAREPANDAYGNSSPQLESRADENRLPSNPASADTVQHQSRFDRFDAVGDKLEDLSREQPLVLIFDDLHAADEPSLALLGHVLWRITDCPILAVITYRPLALPGARGLARLLSETPVRNAPAIKLAPLSISEAAEMVRGTEQGSVLTAAPLVRIAGGNPRFLELLAGKSSAAQSDGPLDAEFHAAADEHLTVSPPARELMETAAVIGERFDLSVLFAVSGLDPAEFLDRLSETQTAGLVRESMDDPGNYYFVYPLVRSALYDCVVGARRAVLHRRVGKALEEVARGDEASVAAIAEHFFRGLTLGDSSKALEYCERAAQNASARHDFQQALRFYRGALTAADSERGVDRSRRARLLFGLAEAQHAVGEVKQARRSFKQAAELCEGSDSHDLYAEALLGWSGWPAVPGPPDQRIVGALESALSALDGKDSSGRAGLMIRLAVELRGFPTAAERRNALLAAGIDMARRVGDGRTLLRGLGYRHELLSGPGAIAERVANAQEMMEAAVASRHNWDYCVAFIYRYSSLIGAGKVARADAEAGALLNQTVNARQPWLRFADDCFGAMRSAIRGRFAETEQVARRVLSFTTPFRSNFEHYFWTAMVLPFEEKGRLGEIVPIAAKAVEHNPTEPIYRAMLAQIECASGQLNAARENFEHLAANGFDSLRQDIRYTASLAALARVCAEIGDADRARTLYAALDPYRASNVVFGPLTFLGPASHYLGLLARAAGNLDQALSDFSEAVSNASQSGARPWSGYAAYYRGLALAERNHAGDREAALDALRIAEEIAAALGMDKLTEQAARLKQACLDGAGAEQAASPHHVTDEPEEKKSPAASEDSPLDLEKNGSKLSGVGRVEFRAEGDTCLLELAGRAVRVHMSRGVKLMLMLLSNPGREFHVSDLETPGSAALRELVTRGSGGARLDAPAKASYRLKLQELREELEEARRFNDVARVSNIEEEIGFLARELARAVGLNGHDRAAYCDAERARSRVTQAIRAAIRNVTSHDEVIGWHLAKSVQTGKFCCYRPGP